jgi:hypothetical protein
MSIMQEALLACVDISKPMYIISQDLSLLNYREKPTFEISAKQISTHSVLGEKGELLKYRHLIGNPKTKAVWAHSYGNKIGRLAQGMPRPNTGTNTIFFIRRDKVPCSRMKDTTYGLISCLVCPEKIDKPNRTRLVVGIRNPVPVNGNHSFVAMYWCKWVPVAQPFIPVIKNTNSHAVAIGYVYRVVRKLFFITKSYLCR